MTHPPVFADHHLSRRLERAEAHAGSRFVEARARLAPDSGAEWIEVAGAYAMYDGTDSPVTQTFGLGLFQPATTADLDKLESFFKDRGAPVFHEVSPLADKSLVPLLGSRSYRPVEFTSVMFLPIADRTTTPGAVNPNIRVRTVREDEQDTWARAAAEGWKEFGSAGDFMEGFARVGLSSEDATAFLAELDGQAIATGLMCIHDSVVLLAGASTIPSARKQGAQRALFDSRLSHAAAVGLRPRHDLRGTRQRIATQCRAGRISHRLHAREMETHAMTVISAGAGDVTRRGFDVGLLSVSHLVRQIAESVLSFTAFKVTLEAAQRHSQHVAMMQLRSKALVRQPQPERVQPVHILRPQSRRVRAKIDVGGWPVRRDDFERQRRPRLRQTLPGQADAPRQFVRAHARRDAGNQPGRL